MNEGILKKTISCLPPKPGVYFFKDKKGLRTRYCWLDTSKFRKKFGENILHSVDESLKLFKKNSDLLEIPHIYQ